MSYAPPSAPTAMKTAFERGCSVGKNLVCDTTDGMFENNGSSAPDADCESYVPANAPTAIEQEFKKGCSVGESLCACDTAYGMFANNGSSAAKSIRG